MRTIEPGCERLATSATARQGVGVSLCGPRATTKSGRTHGPAGGTAAATTRVRVQLLSSDVPRVLHDDEHHSSAAPSSCIPLVHADQDDTLVKMKAETAAVETSGLAGTVVLWHQKTTHIAGALQQLYPPPPASAAGEVVGEVVVAGVWLYSSSAPFFCRL